MSTDAERHAWAKLVVARTLFWRNAPRDPAALVLLDACRDAIAELSALGVDVPRLEDEAEQAFRQNGP